MLVINFKQIKDALKEGKEVFYSNLRILEVSNSKIRTEHFEGFFKPWLPAVKISQ